MKKGNGISYQLFETYYARAKEAENTGRLKEAKEMYLLSGEALLKAAKEVSGETKKALIRRAEKLRKISESICLTETSQQRRQNPTEKKDIEASEKIVSEDTGKVWKSSGKPSVHFSDIAGLADVKESIRRRIILPRLHPEIYQTFQRKVSGGILLYGPPGTGKTMFAKAVACELDAEFFSVHCSDIVGKYFGEAEKNVKSLFETARSVKSAVLFFDEFEALASQRGGDSTVMNRVVPELLSQMDGFSNSENSDILILAATNRPWDIDSAFLRPPRLTEKIYVGLPDYEARLFLINRALDGVPCEEEVKPEQIAQITEGYNSADIVAFCEQLKDDPIARTIKKRRISNITTADIQATAEKFQCSVYQKDLDLIKQWEEKQGKK